MSYDRKVTKQEVEVNIYTKSFLINGTVHVLPLERISDLLDTATKVFLPVTNATIYTVLDHHIVGRTNFLSLNKSEIVILFSKEDEID